MSKISPLSLYIINNCKKRRLIIGRSAKAFARLIDKSEEYVQNIESSRQGHYLQFDYALIADALNWLPHDLLPPSNTPFNDGTVIDKVVFSLSNPRDTEEVLIGMIANNYFYTPKSLENIYDHFFLSDTQEMKKNRQVVSDVLSELVKNGKLKFKDQKYSI